MNQIVSITHEVGRRLAVTTFEWHHEEIGDRMAAAFAAVAQALADQRVAITGPAVGYYRRLEGGLFRASAGYVVHADVQAGETLELLQLPAGDALTTLHRGSFDRLGDSYAALQAFAAGHDLLLDQDVMWEEYYSEHADVPQLAGTRVFWPVAPAVGPALPAERDGRVGEPALV